MRNVSTSTSRWQILVLAISGLLLWVTPHRAMAQSTPTLPTVGVNAGAPIWDGYIYFTDSAAADIAATGCRTIRLNFRLDNNASWTPTLLAKYDTIVQNARKHNLQILGLICNEAITAGQADWNQNYNTTGINAATTEFVNNAWLLIDRYKDHIKVFELWNEPDCWTVSAPSANPLEPGGSYIWPKNYARILAETYKKCITTGGTNYLSANQISFCTGGLFAHDIGGSFSTSRAYFNSVYAETAIWNDLQTNYGRRYPWSYFGYHFYLSQGGPVSTTQLARYFNDIRALKAGSSIKDTSPFLVTEFGWQSPDGVDDALQAANLRDTYNWFKTQSDIASAYWYQWDNGDGGWGLIDDNGIPKPSYTEFALQCCPTIPVARFNASPINGIGPRAVNFFDFSDGIVTSWVWNFGDGTYSFEANPTHTYQNNGTYTVTLAVQNIRGTNSLIKNDFVHVGILGDMDGDGTVDMVDFAILQRCISGADQPQDNPECYRARLDNDFDVDADDVAIFLKCATGPGILAVPTCIY